MKRRWYFTLTYETGMTETVGYDTRKAASIAKRHYEIAEMGTYGPIVALSGIRPGF